MSLQGCCKSTLWKVLPAPSSASLRWFSEGRRRLRDIQVKKRRSLLHADFLVILFHGYMLTRLLLHADAAALEAFCVLIFLSVLPPPSFREKNWATFMRKHMYYCSTYSCTNWSFCILPLIPNMLVLLQHRSSKYYSNNTLLIIDYLYPKYE